MTSPVVLSTATLVVHADTDVNLGVKTATLKLDEARSPYVEATIRIATPAQATLDKLDPRLGYRADLTLGQTWQQPTRPAQSLACNLLLHARRPDFDTGETVLTFRSDEALLIDAALLATVASTTAWANESSLRGIINGVLATVGASALSAGTDDADFTRTANATNLVRNPRRVDQTLDWGASVAGTYNAAGGPAGCPSFVRFPLTAAQGSTAFMVTYAEAGVAVSGTRTYVESVWIRSTVAANFSLDALVMDASGTTLLDVLEPVVAVPANTWTRMSVTWTAPASATKARLRVFNLTALASGVTVDVTGFRVSEQTTAHDTDYFDGSSADVYYTYAWTGTAHGSTSTRTRTDSRSLDVLTWQPGVKAWDFLQPLVQAAGLRLWCDEQRVWRLAKSNSYLVDGSILVAVAQNLIGGSESIDRGGEWATGVVVKYTWTDAAGMQQTRYDTAGTNVNVTLVEWPNTPYPGAGAAAVVLGRLQGRGRVLDLPALAELTAKPGQYVQATIPNAPVQTGVASSIEWTWPDATMQVGTRGLIDTPATAWIFLAAGVKWTDSPAGASWISE